VPPRSSIHIAAEAPKEFALTDEELQCCERFSSKRISDFVAGRYCASEALAKLGLDRVSIPIGDSREPVWPATIIGSIAHTDRLAGAIAASDMSYLGLGLDLEKLQPLDNIATQICTEKELEFQRNNSGFADYLNVVFSAKEAVYKCVWPIVQKFISFRDLELAMDAPAKHFRVSWNNDVHPHITRIHGSWATADGLISTIAILTRDEDKN
jgi:4'-phosphopantetheinyl transferase EntD